MPDIVRSNKSIFLICFILWAVITVRAVMNAKGTDAFEITVSQSEVQAFARQQLATLQPQSFAEDQEFCAIIFEDSEGQLGASPTISGDEGGCNIAFFDEPGMGPVASIHTHAAFNEEYDSEVPSTLDMNADIDSGYDGYIATPGGRFWRIDAEAGLARQICEENCLAQDPAYRACDTVAPEQSYTFDELEARMLLAHDNSLC